ncbi:MAG: hypothetical protein CMF80_08230 [Candidatus Marinimicrobia bacterium]|nr:hypothetical protein [Candidatus Neomarinimicrobiota bacterium]|tara:strand:- start:505 stop:1026 length:522 start_codon:yes stop_codon:yes gene_type:complete
MNPLEDKEKTKMKPLEKIQCFLFGKVLFSQEIMSNIFEYSTHRMSNDVMDEIIRTTVHKKYDMIEMLWKNRSHSEQVVLFCDLIKKYIYDPENAVIALSTCKCCPRHQHHRPKKLEIYWESDFFEGWNPQLGWKHLHGKQNEFDQKCLCPCRHRARWICRVFMPEPDPLVHNI